MQRSAENTRFCIDLKTIYFFVEFIVFPLKCLRIHCPFPRISCDVIGFLMKFIDSLAISKEFASSGVMGQGSAV